MRKIKPIIKKSSYGTYSIYHEDVLPYLITSTGDTLEEAKADFLSYYEEAMKLSASNNLAFEEVEWEL